jgi:hypothetical protein
MWAENAMDRRLPPISHEHASRHQNDSLIVTARELGIQDDAPFVFVCECRDDLCNDNVRLSIAEYASRRSAGRDILCPGHLTPCAEDRAA